jgi:predicted DCC family thiol-disulfide oxidoreductase YuxK
MLSAARTASRAARFTRHARLVAVGPPRARFGAAPRAAGTAAPRAAAPTTTTSSTTPSPSSSSSSLPLPDWPPTAQIAMLHDGDCPLCEREVKMLRGRDAGAGKILFIDVADPGYESGPGKALGISYETAMRTIHGVERDGTVLTGVAVFKRLYDLVGLGWVYGFMSVPPLRRAAEAAYNAWAAARLPITGRPGLEAVLAERKTCK